MRLFLVNKSNGSFPSLLRGFSFCCGYDSIFLYMYDPSPRGLSGKCIPKRGWIIRMSGDNRNLLSPINPFAMYINVSYSLPNDVESQGTRRSCGYNGDFIWFCRQSYLLLAKVPSIYIRSVSWRSNVWYCGYGSMLTIYYHTNSIDSNDKVKGTRHKCVSKTINYILFK